MRTLMVAFLVCFASTLAVTAFADEFKLDIAPGVAWAGEEVPPGGTDFNITFRSGPGITYLLRPDLHLLAGVRYVHWSNAEMHGRDRNPSVNGVEGYVGVMFAF